MTTSAYLQTLKNVLWPRDVESVNRP
jgi:hypothetical protein